MSGQAPDWILGLCGHVEHFSTVYRDKIYVLGGAEWIHMPARFNLTAPLFVTDSHLRILDFTRPFSLLPSGPSSTLPSPFETLQRLPDHIPRTKRGLLFAHAGKLRYFGGQCEEPPIINDDGTLPADATKVGRDLPGRVYTYDIARGSWDAGEGAGAMAALSAWGGDVVGNRNTVMDGETGTAWVFGGTYHVTGWSRFMTANFSREGFTVQGSVDKQLTTFKSFDIEDGVFESIRAPPQQAELFNEMKAVFIPRVGGKGIVVHFGGLSPMGMKEVHVFDVASGNWFTQFTTSADGTSDTAWPSPRQQFCTVAASAPDMSSHNIYMFGGWTTATASDGTKSPVFSDVYVLSLPAFRWVYMGRAPQARQLHTCNVLRERFMVSYQGMMLRHDSKFCNDARTGGAMVLDMSEMRWLDRWEVDGTQGYKVPEKVWKMVGGDENGGATMREPVNGFTGGDRLKALFNTNPPSSTSGTPPLPSGSTNSTNNGTLPGDSQSSSSSSSSALSRGALSGIIVGSILGFLLLLLLLWYIFIHRRRRAHSGAPAAPYPDPLELPAPGPSYYGSGPGGYYPQSYAPVAELSPSMSPVHHQGYYGGGVGGGQGVYAELVADQMARELAAREPVGKELVGSGGPIGGGGAQPAVVVDELYPDSPGLGYHRS